MSSYSGTADRPDKAKAIVAVVAVHGALALLILSGLNVKRVGQAVEQLTTTIEIRQEPAPPPIERPRPARRPQPIRKAEGAAARRANPTPIAAPQPKIPQPSPVASSRLAATGTSPNSGAASAGSGTGAGSRGSGGGGYGDYSRFTPARLVSNIPNSQYSRLAATGIPSGSVGVLILVNANGSVSNCRIARSSGDPAIDGLVCALTEQYVRFEPARDPYGRPVAQDITYFPNWRRR